ncbi:CDP-diacylglycerol--serine O-phosphatidyltransferase [Sodaliphilus sp.]|uniref:CDP-diacylglycerol--serine O-phosphatidyltransferase n=1 Tax=Sodaliphilus sp. TaxID=2815818 RepID=UPI00388E1B9C
MNAIKNNIPNAITSLNLLCGAMAIVMSFSGKQEIAWGLNGFEMAYALIALAAVADFFDGFSARLLHAVSNIGAELDSLSDLVSFGLAPAMVLLNMMRGYDEPWWCYVALLLGVFGAVRLARFNVDTNQTTTFTGLPIPANAIFWIGFTAWYAEHQMPVWAVAIAVVALSYLMVCPLRMFSLKLHSMSVKENWAQYLLILSTVALVATLGLPGLAVMIALYVIISIVKHEK